MNRIEKLIEDLCPNGVKYYKLNQVAEFTNTGIDKKHKENEDEVSLLNFKDVFRLDEIKSKDILATTTVPKNKKLNALIKKHDIFITPSSEVKDEIGMSTVIAEDIPNAVYSYHIARVRIKDFNQINPYFLSYLFRSASIRNQIDENSQGITRYGLTKPKWESLVFPIPPIQIQNEIVNILDKYTELKVELKADLETELHSRRKQYDLYLRKLLSCEGVSHRDLELRSIGNVSMCKRILKSETTTSGDIPFYKIGTFGKVANSYISREIFEDYVKKYHYPKKGDLLISAAGTIGRIVIFDGEPSYFQDSNIVWLNHDESQVLNSYLFYCFQIAEWTTQKSSIKRLYNDNLLKLKIRVPVNRFDQIDIVKKLSSLEALVSNIETGISTESQARGKQYEYYREKLLTFKELELA